MIRELSRNNVADWDERIQLELDLADIQAIFDCVNAIPSEYLMIRHKHTPFNGKRCYTDLLNDIYESLYVILCEHNGVTNNNPMVTNVKVEIVGDKK